MDPIAEAQSTEMRMKVAICTVLLVCLTGNANSENCSAHCRRCGSDERCLNCTSGYYGVHCIPCSPRCKDALCLFDLCSEGCETGRFGYSCDRNCSQCIYGCDQWLGICHKFPESRRKTRQHPSWVEGIYISNEYRILGIILSVSTIAVLVAIVVFCKLMKHSRRRFAPKRQRQSSVHGRRSIHRETTADTVIWETNSDMSTSMTSNNICRTATNINIYSPTPTTGRCSDLFGVSGEEPVHVETEPLVTTGWDVVRIVVSPPSPHRRSRRSYNKMRL